MPSASDGWRVTTDHERVRQWAERHDAVPVRRSNGIDRVRLDVVPRADADPDARVTWDRFFEVFEAQDRAFRYREGASGDDAACDLVDRDDVDRTGSPTGSDGDAPEREHFATSDTGESEPVVSDRLEGDESAAGAADAARESDADPDAGAAVDETDVPLALDELYEDPGPGTSSGEYVAFANEGSERLDLSGWRVENGAGLSYEFPDGTALEPDERLVLYSASGTDEPGELYWNADESVWGDRGGTVVVRTADGRRVLREPYEA